MGMTVLDLIKKAMEGGLAHMVQGEYRMAELYYRGFFGKISRGVECHSVSELLNSLEFDLRLRYLNLSSNNDSTNDHFGLIDRLMSSEVLFQELSFDNNKEVEQQFFTLITGYSYNVSHLLELKQLKKDGGGSDYYDQAIDSEKQEINSSFDEISAFIHSHVSEENTVSYQREAALPAGYSANSNIVFHKSSITCQMMDNSDDNKGLPAYDGVSEEVAKAAAAELSRITGKTWQVDQDVSGVKSDFKGQYMLYCEEILKGVPDYDEAKEIFKKDLNGKGIGCAPFLDLTTTRGLHNATRVIAIFTEQSFILDLSRRANERLQLQDVKDDNAFDRQNNPQNEQLDSSSKAVYDVNALEEYYQKSKKNGGAGGGWYAKRSIFYTGFFSREKRSYEEVVATLNRRAVKNTKNQKEGASNRTINKFNLKNNK